MVLTFLDHQWKSFWRSRNKAGNIVARIVLGLFILYFILLALGAGFFMETLIKKIFPGENVVTVYNGIILYYFLADLLMRIQLQELPTLSIVPYLHLNIAKRKIVNFLNIKALFSAFNFIPLILLLPFCFTRIASTYGGWVSVMYAVSIISLVVFNNYFVLYLKRKSISNILYVAVGIGVVGIFGALEYFKIISISAGANWVFKQVALYPLIAFGFTVLAIAIYFVNSIYLRNNLYTEELSTRSEEKASTDYAFLNRFGKVGELAALELKLILRHKRSRSALYMGFLFLLYGFFFYKPSLLDKDEFGAMLFAAIFITGISIIMYGQFMFAWQSAHFDGLLANKIDMKNFIKAKFLLFTISCTIITLLSTFYGFMSWKLLLLHLAAYLYNIGFGTVIVLWFATKNYKRLDLTKGASFNWQGTGAVQWIMGFPLLLFPFIIYLPFGMTDQPFLGLLALALFGLITLLMRNFWVKHLTKILLKKRYKIAEGFRE